MVFSVAGNAETAEIIRVCIFGRCQRTFRWLAVAGIDTATSAAGESVAAGDNVGQIKPLHRIAGKFAYKIGQPLLRRQIAVVLPSTIRTTFADSVA